MIFDHFDSPELLDIQRTGFYRFLNQGIPQLLAKEFPIKVKNGNYSIELCLNENSIKLIAPEDDPRNCILKMKTYNCKLYAQVQIVCKKSSGKIVYQGFPEWVLLGQLPMMTKRGHFIINGSPRVIVHQVVRAPGIYFQKLRQKDDQNRARFYGDIIPLKGAWVRLQMSKKGRVEAKFKKGKKVEVEFLQKCLQVIENQSVLNSAASHTRAYNCKAFYMKETHSLLYDDYSKLLDKKKSKAESKAEHDAFVHTYDKLYRTTQDKELEEWQKKKKNQIFFKNSFFDSPSSSSNEDGTLPLQISAFTEGDKPFTGSDPVPYKSSYKSSICTYTCTKALQENLYAAKTKSNGVQSESLKGKSVTQLKENKKKVKPNSFVSSSSPDNLFKRKKCSENLFATFKLQSRYDLGLLGREKINDKFGRSSAFLKEKKQKVYRVDENPLITKGDTTQLTALDLCSATLWLYKLRKGSQNIDDIDHSQNRRVRTSGELLQTQFENGVYRLKNLLSTKLQEWRGDLTGLSFSSIFKISFKTRYNPKISFKRERPLQILAAKPFTEGVPAPSPTVKGKDLYGAGSPSYKSSICTKGKAAKKEKLSYFEKKSFVSALSKSIRRTPFSFLHPDRLSIERGLPPSRYKVCAFEQKAVLQRKAKVTPPGVTALDGETKLLSLFMHQRCKKINKALGSPSYKSFTGLQSRALHDKICTKGERLCLSWRQSRLPHTNLRFVRATKVILPLRATEVIQDKVIPLSPSYKSSWDNCTCTKAKICKEKNLYVKAKICTKFVRKKNTPCMPIRERHAKGQKVDKISYVLSAKELFSTKPITGALREFFGSNPLSQYMDQTNPLAEITHKRRISSLGIGGVSRESAGMAIRGIHPTHYGRICPIETPEGKNAGLVNSLAFYTKVDQNGFLKTPYYRVFKGQVQSSLGFSFCSAKEESLINLQIAPSDLQKSSNDVLRTRFSTLESVPVRVADSFLDVFKKENPYRVQLIAISPIQMISVATSLIPFLEHNDANRALMGSNMQRQAVPLMISERPVLGTGLESIVIVESGHITESQTSGFASHVAGNKVIVDRLVLRKKESLLQRCTKERDAYLPFVQQKPKNYFYQIRAGKVDDKLPLQLSQEDLYGAGSPSCKAKHTSTNRSPKGQAALPFLAAKPPAPYKSSICKGNEGDPRFVRRFVRTCTKGFAAKTRFVRTCTSPLSFASKTLAAKPPASSGKFFEEKPYKSFTEGDKVIQDKSPSYKSSICTCTKAAKRFLHTKSTAFLQIRDLYARRVACKTWHAVRVQIEKHPQKKRESSFLISTELRLSTFSRSNQNSCMTEKPLVREFDWVQKGDVVSDCSASKNGELAVGKNVLLAYIPWEGYNFEDAIVINERLVREHVYTSLHIERYVFQAQDLKDGNEWFTKHLPGVESSSIQHLEESGLPKIGSFLKEGDLLVGKIRYLNKKPSTPYERLLCDILGEKNFAARNKSLYVPKGVEARVIYHKVISFFENDPENKVRPLEAAKTVHLFLGEKRVIQVGDKISGRHGNKGVISTILPRQDMPYLPDGTPIDVILNPLGVPSRMNVGQVLECLLGLAASYLNQHFKVAAFDERYGVEASKSIVFLKLYQARLQSGQNWLFQVNFPGKTRLVDGRSGECFDQWITVGKAYILKLIHMVSEKIHARSTGPYALITQQPLRGRSNKGGQRLGEMEVWALEGFGAAYTLQELLTKKSDDFFGRKQIVDSILPNPTSIVDTLKPSHRIDKNLNVLGHPEIFKVLLCELQALCLDLGVYILTPESFQRSFLGVVH